MSNNFCDKCDAFLYSTNIHSCSPAWEVLIDDYHGDDDGMIVYAYDAETAAEIAVQKWDAQGDYICVGGEEITVRVIGADKSVKKFVVTGQSTPSYYATEVKE
jgi:hypothetical protein